jgi:hypothetical protein
MKWPTPSKVVAVLGAGLILLGTSILVHTTDTLPSFSIYKLDQFAAVSKSATSKRNNVFKVKALKELKLFAPILQPINPFTTKTTATNVITTPAIIPIVINPISIPTPKPTTNPLASQFSSKNNNPSSAVVNILCSIPQGNMIKQISSSGVLISSTGLILTNAHVGIHPFISAYGNQSMSCKIRSGSPALTNHALSFIFISPNWTARHKGETSGIVGIDSGNADFAILKATLPTDILKFATPISIRNTGGINPLYIFSKDGADISFSPDLSIGQSVTAIGYPITSSNSGALTKKQDQLSIRDLFGFSSGVDQQDLIETSASTIGKNGSSGGAIVDTSSYLIALIANVIPTSSPDQTYIRAISLDHINTSLLDQAGISLHNLIDSDGSNLKQIFESRHLGSVKSDLLR